jgi:hypothetical protein
MSKLPKDIDCSSTESDNENIVCRDGVSQPAPYVKGQNQEDEIPAAKTKKPQGKKPYQQRQFIEFKSDPMDGSQSHPRSFDPRRSYPPSGRDQGGNGGFATNGYRYPTLTDEERNAQLYKTKMCKGVEGGGTCDAGDGCRYAHSPEELRCFWGTRCRTKDHQGEGACQKLHVDVREELKNGMHAVHKKPPVASPSSVQEMVVIRVPRDSTSRGNTDLMEKMAKMVTARIEFRVEYA